MATQREWECPECGQVFRGQYPPEECPVCGEPLADVDLYDLEEQDDWLSDESDADPLDDELGDIEAVLLDDEDVDADLSVAVDAESSDVDDCAGDDVGEDRGKVMRRGRAATAPGLGS